MSKRSALVALSLLAFPTLSAAQEAVDRDPDFAGSVINHDMFSDMQRMMVQFGRTQRDADNCWKVGCVLIVNETQSYDVVGFYVDTAKPGTASAWSRNQFGEPLRPMKVTMRFKTGGADTCNIPVRFVLRDRQTKEKLDVAGTASLCTSPHQDTLLQIKAPRGTVTVLPADPEPAKPAR